MKNERKCIVMFSGGLDSCLAVKVMKKQSFDVVALFFKMPFLRNESDSIKNFCKKNKVKLNIFDCTKGKLLQEYSNVIKNPNYGRGAGINPCIDCRIFMLMKAKEFADANGIELIVTGEVLGERPMSQTKRAMNLIEEESGLKGRLLRPLSAKLFPETKAEKKEIVVREKLYGIQGRNRKKQIAIAESFKIDYPTPAGGCLLCEEALKKRFKKLLDRGLNEGEVVLVGIGRHFIISNCWIVLGRNQEENKIIESVGKETGKLIIPDYLGPSAIILDKYSRVIEKKVNNLIKAYSKKGSLKKRGRFERYKL